MTELIKYFESLEARIAALEEAQQTNEAVIASLEAEVEELKNRPLPQPEVIEKVVEKVVEVEKPVEVIKEVVVEKPGASPQSNGESGLRLEGQEGDIYIDDEPEEENLQSPISNDQSASIEVEGVTMTFEQPKDTQLDLF